MKKEYITPEQHITLLQPMCPILTSSLILTIDSNLNDDADLTDDLLWGGADNDKAR